MLAKIENVVTYRNGRRTVEPLGVFKGDIKTVVLHATDECPNRLPKSGIAFNLTRKQAKALRKALKAAL